MTKRVMALLALSAALLMSTGCNKLRARDQLNKGVQAYKGARYEQAIEFFKNAVAFDPNLAVAKLYLATAYAQQYVPGVDSPENNKMGEQAIQEYKEVLRQSGTSDENRVTANKGIASIYFNSKKFDEAKQFHSEVLKLDPKDPETYYSIGGGFVVTAAERLGATADRSPGADPGGWPYPFASAASMLAMAREAGLSIAAMKPLSSPCR